MVLDSFLKRYNMPIPGIIQPEYVTVSEEIRLHKFIINSTFT